LSLQGHGAIVRCLEAALAAEHDELLDEYEHASGGPSAGTRVAWAGSKDDKAAGGAEAATGGTLGGMGVTGERLRLELTGMKMSALRKRALAADVGSDALEVVDDSDDPKTAMVALLLKAHADGEGGEDERLGSAALEQYEVAIAALEEEALVRNGSPIHFGFVWGSVLSSKRGRGFRSRTREEKMSSLIGMMRTLRIRKLPRRTPMRAETMDGVAPARSRLRPPHRRGLLSRQEECPPFSSAHCS
jgi:hypothetical protein